MMGEDIIHCREHGWDAGVKQVLDRLEGLVEPVGCPCEYFRHWLIDHAGARDRRQHLTGSVPRAVAELRRLEAEALSRKLAL